MATAPSLARVHALTHPPFVRAVPERQSFPDKEEEILAWWEKNDTFRESVRLSEGRKPWSFYDGPPFATGLPHYGHILAGTIKVRAVHTPEYLEPSASSLTVTAALSPRRTSCAATRTRPATTWCGASAGVRRPRHAQRPRRSLLVAVR